MAKLLEKREKRDEAAERLDRAVKLTNQSLVSNPGNPTYFILLHNISLARADLHLKLGDHAAAILSEQGYATWPIFAGSGRKPFRANSVGG